MGGKTCHKITAWWVPTPHVHPITCMVLWIPNAWWLCSEREGTPVGFSLWLFIHFRAKVGMESAGSIGLSCAVPNPVVTWHIACLLAQRWPKKNQVIHEFAHKVKILFILRSISRMDRVSCREIKPHKLGHT